MNNCIGGYQEPPAGQNRWEQKSRKEKKRKSNHHLHSLQIVCFLNIHRGFADASKLSVRLADSSST